MLPLSLLQKLTIIDPFVGTILKRSFAMVVTGPWGLALAKKNKREMIIQRVLNFMVQESSCNLQ